MTSNMVYDKIKQMKGKEIVKNGKDTIAIVFRADIGIDGLSFLTEEENLFQIGLHNKPKGIKLRPHTHVLPKPILINSIQELLYIQKGKIRVNLFDENGKFLQKKILTRDDSILFISGGHGVDFIEDSKIFEIKQGPYPGKDAAKKYFPQFDFIEKTQSK